MLKRSAAGLAMSTRVLEALPGKLDIKRHSPSILYIPVPTLINQYTCMRKHCVIVSLQTRTLTNFSEISGADQGFLEKGIHMPTTHVFVLVEFALKTH